MSDPVLAEVSKFLEARNFQETAKALRKEQGTFLCLNNRRKAETERSQTTSPGQAAIDSYNARDEEA